MKIDWFAVLVALMILAVTATGGLFLHLLWDLEGWYFIGSLALSAGIASIGLYAIPDFVRMVRRAG